MTKDQDIKIISASTTKDFLNQNIAIVNTLPNGASNLALLNSTHSAILIEAKIQESSKKGYTDSVNSLKKNLVFEASDTARKMITFAKFTHNLILLAEIRQAKDKLGNGSKVDIIKNAQLIYDKVQSNIASLPSYNINATTQTTLSASISAFTAAFGKIGIRRTEGVQSTERLKQLFKTLSTTLSAISDAVEIVRTSKPDFYKGFKSSKKTPTKSTSKPMLKGVAVDVNGNTIKGILIEMFLLDSEGNPIQDKKTNIKRTTGKKGGFKVQNTSDGTYIAKLKNLKYAEEQVKISLAKGQVVKLKVVMKRNIVG